MGQLSISDELLDRVAELARARRLPIEVQAEEMLRGAIDRQHAPGDLRRMFDEIAALTPKDVPQTDSLILIREDRDR